MLDQLSLTSWLPAAMLIGNAALLLQMNRAGNANVVSALRALTAKPLGTLIVLFFALLLATIVTQAFEFEAIQKLEGYFGSTNRLLGTLVAVRIRCHKERRQDIADRLKGARTSAFRTAKRAMDEQSVRYPPDLVAILNDVVLGNGHPDDLDPSVLFRALDLDWYAEASAVDLYRMSALESRLLSYPGPTRIMPTRLGNVLRAGEDRLTVDSGESLEGYALRYLDQMPYALRKEQRDYRTRLDLYCTLVLIFCILVALSVGLMWSIASTWLVILVGSAYAVMAYTSYGAAIASAHGYVNALREIDLRVRNRGRGDGS